MQKFAFHYENTPIQKYRKFYLQKKKKKKNQMENQIRLRSRWGGSNEYPQSMVLSRNKKNNVYPVNTSFTI